MDRILAIDTGAEACSVALRVDGRLLENYEASPREHSKMLLPMLDSLLREAGLGLAELQGIAYIRGPGSFTGLRIGVSAVQGLAYGANLPTLGLSSLQCHAASALDRYGVNPAQALMVMLDARMNEVYWGLYRPVAGVPVLLGRESVSTVETLAIDDERDFEIIGIGSGWKDHNRLPDQIKARVAAVYEGHSTRAADIFSLLGALGDQAPDFVTTPAMPVYVRSEISWKKLSEQKKSGHPGKTKSKV